MPNLYQLKIQLIGVTKPPVWRLIELPESTNLYHLHYLIQGAMGWENEHLHEFTQFDQSYSVPSPYKGEPVTDSRKVRIDKLLKNIGDTLTYLYDFGDGWEHSIVLKKITPYKGKAGKPALLDGKGACPPEDCGGHWAYEDIKLILSDPKHPDYADWLDNLGLDESDKFDPNDFDLEVQNEIMLEFLHFAIENKGDEFFM